MVVGLLHSSRRCVTALALSLLSLSIFCAAASAELVQWTGYISDAKCGSKMTGYCAKSCIAAGEKPVFVTDSKQVLPISNPDLTKGHEGERVAITGEVNDGKLMIKTLEPSSKH